jgi:hypothetical protein
LQWHGPFSNPAVAGPSIDRIELVFVADPVCAPGALDAALVIDRSGSMAGAPLHAEMSVESEFMAEGLP